MSAFPSTAELPQLYGHVGVANSSSGTHILRLLIDALCLLFLTSASIHLQPARFDWVLPARDLVRHEFGEVLGASLLWPNAGHADVVHTGLDHGRFHGLMRDFVKLVHDCTRRVF